MTKRIYKPFTCVICTKVIKGQWGNNPWPITEEGKCCNACNAKEVIPMRLLDLARADALTRARRPRT